MNLYWLDVAVTALLFAGVCGRMLNTPRYPSECWKCQIQFVLWAGAHIAIVLVVGLYFLDGISALLPEVRHRYLILKFALAVLFLYPWKTKVVGL